MSNMSGLRRKALLISSIERPGWVPGLQRTPEVGEAVYTVHGRAEVVRVLGKVSDGSRLLELRLDEPKTPPFFAASSNVLVRNPDGEGPPDPEQDEEATGTEPGRG